MMSRTLLLLSCLLASSLAHSDDVRDRSRQALDAAAQAARSGAVRSMPNIELPSNRNSIDVAKIAESYRRMDAPESDEGLLIFVSNSMPRAALLRLARDARRAGAVLVFRGIKGDLTNQSWLKSMEAIKPLTDTGASVQIHPDLFKTYQVRSVPTFVLTREGKHACDAAEACNDKLVAVGDASLGYVLDRWSDAGGELGKLARTRLNRLENAR